MATRTFSLNVEKIGGIVLVPHNIVMDLNNVKFE